MTYWWLAWFIVWLIVWLPWAGFTGWLAREKGRNFWDWAFLGFGFGPIALLAVGFAGPGTGPRTPARANDALLGAEDKSRSILVNDQEIISSAVRDRQRELELRYPREYQIAIDEYQRLGNQPQFPLQWLEELCKLIRAGAAPDAAAQSLPLDFTAPGP